jgi:hypothetical protein
MGKFLKVFLLSLILIFSSCIKYEEEMILNNDFSGSIYMDFLFSNLTDEDSQSLEKELDKLKERAKQFKGVDVVFAKKEILGSNTRYKIKLKFSHIKRLEAFFNENNGKDSLGNGLYNFKLTSKDGLLKYERNIKLKGISDDLGENFVFKEFVRSILANYIWKFSVRFPYEVIETNGELLDDKRTVRWEYDLYKLTEDSVKMEALMKEPSFIERLIMKIKSLFN